MLDMACTPCYLGSVIRTWKNTATRRFAESGGAKGRFSGLDEVKGLSRLQQLDAAWNLDVFTRYRSLGLHKLGGDREGFWAVTINGPWRLVFRFESGDAFDVEIVDYH